MQSLRGQWIVNAVDLSKDGHLGLFAGFPCDPPDQFGLDGLKNISTAALSKQLSLPLMET